VVPPGQLRCGALNGCKPAVDSVGRSCRATRVSGGAAACSTPLALQRSHVCCAGTQAMAAEVEVAQRQLDDTAAHLHCR
jgi:hypothetical protein